MKRIRLKTAHGTYLRAGDTGEVNQSLIPGPWEEFIEEELAPPPPPPLPYDPWKWDGNFLAFPGAELGKGESPFFMQFAWNQDKRNIMIPQYGLAHTHLPVTQWAKYGGLQYDYRNDPAKYLAELDWMKQFIPGLCHFILTDHLNRAPWNELDARNYMDIHLSSIANKVDMLCLGWEFSEIPGLDDADLVVRLLSHARSIIGPNKILFYHDQPNWWAPAHSDGRSEWDFWRDANACNGLLFQLPYNISIDEMKYTLFEIPWNSQPTGIVGRINLLNKRAVVFEHSRLLNQFNNVIGMLKSKTGHYGWC
jgi:hypothetical protein